MSENPTEAVALGARLLKAMAHVGRIEKEGKVAFAGTNYSYMTEEQVKVACQAACIHADVMPVGIRIEVISDDWLEISGKHHNLVKVRATIQFAEANGEGHDYQGIGSSADKGDKAYMQAQTGAIREAWKNAFIIPSGSDPETNHPEDSPEGTQEAAKTDKGRVGARARQEPQKSAETPGVKLRTEEQASQILAMLEQVGMSRAAGSALCQELFKVTPPKLTHFQATAFLEHLDGVAEEGS